MGAFSKAIFGAVVAAFLAAALVHLVYIETLQAETLQAKTQSKGQRQTIDRVAAVIEEEIITVRELEAKAEPFLQQLADIADPKVYEERRDAIVRKVLDIEIGERIVNREVERNQDKLGVTEAQVDRAIAEVMRNRNLTREQLQAALYGQGMTWSEYRSKIREQIARMQLIQFRVQGKVQVDEADVKRRCKERQLSGAQEVQACASHVLLTIPDGATPEQVQEIEGRALQLQVELAQGADFAAYAMKYSDDKGAPDGDLGCFGRGEMVQAFEDAAFSTAVGGVSKVVRTSFGFHIIRVNDRRVAGTTSCDDEQLLQDFRQEIYQEEMERQMTQWIDELRARAFVDIRY